MSSQIKVQLFRVLVCLLWITLGCANITTVTAAPYLTCSVPAVEEEVTGYQVSGEGVEVHLPAPLLFDLSTLPEDKRYRLELRAVAAGIVSEPVVFDIYRDSVWSPVGKGVKTSVGAVVYRVVLRR